MKSSDNQKLKSLWLSPRTAALWTGLALLVFQLAPLGMLHLPTALWAKKLYCRARACPDVKRVDISCCSRFMPSENGSVAAALTACTHAIGAMAP